ncbi:WxL domain-containing protein (plasmid) [Lactococcus garvieae]|uniref:WxL domain-containing protein n=1 Tax=Lactococcus garvieae TaxID=1363 RepID=UPI0030D1DB0A
MNKQLLFTSLGVATLTVLALAPIKADADQTGTTQADASFASGSLVLNQVPNKFDFGTLPLSTSTVIQPLSADDSYDLVVTDTRGMENGYRVTASAPVMTSLDGQHQLNGNNIHLTNPTVSEVGSGGNTSAPTTNNDFYADAVDQDGNPIPTVVSTASTDSSQGNLTWKTSWNGADVNFIVQPGEAQATQYRTNITWTLSDAPGA